MVGLLDGNGAQVVSYKYNSWGKLLTVNDESTEQIGLVNPFRYRGYILDDETGIYYLKSRYYDPEVGRFINADSVLSVDNDFSNMNLYAYCGNNPVNRNDSNGCAWKDVKAWFAKAHTKVKNVLAKVRNVISNGVKIGKEAFSKHIGITTKVSIGKESHVITDGIIKNEIGVEYGTEIGDKKTINIYASLEEGSYGVGVEADVYGYGGSVQLVGERKLTLNLRGYSLEHGMFYNKVSYTNESGTSMYSEWSVSPKLLNTLKVACVAGVIGVVNVPEIAIIMGKAYAISSY